MNRNSRSGIHDMEISEGIRRGRLIYDGVEIIHASFCVPHDEQHDRPLTFPGPPLVIGAVLICITGGWCVGE